MSEIERTSPNSARATALYEREPRELLRAAGRAIDGLPNWSISEQDESEIQAVRATRLLRFKDDVTVRAVPVATPGQSRLDLTSSSRIGKSDLGQSPRNLRELLGVIHQELG